MSENVPERPSTDKVKIAVIIVVGIILLACILASAGIAIAFCLNAPWAVPC